MEEIQNPESYNGFRGFKAKEIGQPKIRLTDSFGILKKLIKKAVKLLGSVMSVAIIALVGYLVYAINPWNVPAIFKRNYPEWFAAHPFISSLIKVD